MASMKENAMFSKQDWLLQLNRILRENWRVKFIGIKSINNIIQRLCVLAFKNIVYFERIGFQHKRS